jgi:deazaflavin-dependent oxidoreductase (nitroreductase family)
MPSDFLLKSMNTIHRGIITLTGNKVGWKAGGMPVLKLTTTGRRSGQPRTVMLTSPLQEGDTWVIVASRGGDDDHPAWFLNLRDNPSVTIETGPGTSLRATARIASASERERLWPQITAAYSNYASYQQRTQREIPLVIIEPHP